MTVNDSASDAQDMARNGMLSGKKSKKLGDLALNKMDLEFCRDLLKEDFSKLNKISVNLPRALWMSIIVKFVSCFDGGSKSRNNLDYKKVFKNDGKMIDAFLLFDNLRKKYFVHDDNYYYQQRVAVNFDGNKNIIELLTVAIRADLNNNIYELAQEIIDKSLYYVNKKILQIGKEIYDEVSSLPKAEISKLPPLSFAGNVLDASKNRLDDRDNLKGEVPSIITRNGKVIFSMTIKFDLAWKPDMGPLLQS